HSNASTTLRYYARWIPSKGRRWADLLDRLTDFLGSKLGTKKWNQNAIGHSGLPEGADFIGGPSRTRTLDPLIKSFILRLQVSDTCGPPLCRSRQIPARNATQAQPSPRRAEEASQRLPARPRPSPSRHYPAALLPATVRLNAPLTRESETSWQLRD